MLIYPLRIYTSCIPHGVDNNIIHIRGCGKTDLLLLWVTYKEILPASHPTVYIYAESYVYVMQIYVIYRRYWIRIDTIYNTWIGYIDSININIYVNCLSCHMWITSHTWSRCSTTVLSERQEVRSFVECHLQSFPFSYFFQYAWVVFMKMDNKLKFWEVYVLECLLLACQKSINLFF